MIALWSNDQREYACGVGHKVVCISSQDGAGAQEAAQLVASWLGFRLIDEDIVTRAAIEAGVDEGVVADVERRKSRVVRLIEGLGSAGLGAGYVVPGADIVSQGEPASDELRGMIRSVIEDTAARGSAVIVSHAASLALAERDLVINTEKLAPEHAARLIVQAAGGRANAHATGA